MSDLCLPPRLHTARLDVLRLVTFLAMGVFCATFWVWLARALFA